MIFNKDNIIQTFSELQEANAKWERLSGKALYKLVIASVHYSSEHNIYYYMCRLNGFANSALFSQFIIRRMLINNHIIDESIGLDLTIEIIGAKLDVHKHIKITSDLSRATEAFNRSNKLTATRDSKPDFASVNVIDDTSIAPMTKHDMAYRNRLAKSVMKLSRGHKDIDEQLKIFNDKYTYSDSEAPTPDRALELEKLLKSRRDLHEQEDLQERASEENKK